MTQPTWQPSQYAATPPQKPKRKRPVWVWITVGVAALVLLYGILVGISSLIGLATSDKAAAPAKHTPSLVEQRSDPSAVLGAASKLCADAIRRQAADPDATFTPDGWTITATNPAGRSQPSWRVQGVTEERGSPRTPLQFLCDVEWLPATDQYQATLVG